jgi:hypothetical protein
MMEDAIVHAEGFPAGEYLLRPAICPRAKRFIWFEPLKVESWDLK